MTAETFGPLVPTTFWGLVVTLVLIAAPIPIRALADEPSPAGNAQRQTAQDRCEFLLDNASAIILSLDKITFLSHYGGDFFEYSAKEILDKPVLGTLTPATGFEGRDLASFLDGLRRDPDRYAFSVNQNVLRTARKSGYSGPTKAFTMIEVK